MVSWEKRGESNDHATEKGSIREFVQVSAIWKSIPGEVTRLLKFSGNVGFNSVTIERNTFTRRKRSTNKSPVLERNTVCAKN